MPQQEQEISWRVASHHLRERTNDWFWWLGAAAIIGAAASIFFGNALLAIIIILGAGSIGFLATQTPREHTVSISPRGISIDGTRYPYKSVHSFWVEEHQGDPKLYLSMSGILSSHFSLYIAEGVEPDQVRKYLKRYAAEEEQGPQIGERVAEIFGL
jgi:hypothetical protein